MKDSACWKLALLVLSTWAAAMTDGATAPSSSVDNNSNSNNMQSHNSPNTISSSSNNNNANNNRHRQLIINGHKAPRGRYPYFSTLDHECGGALIAPDVILTAGHCLPQHRTSVEPQVGTYSFLDDDTSAEGFRIVDMIRHSHWKRLGGDEFRHDLALLVLDRPSRHNHVKLNRDDNLPAPHQTVTAMGVGWTSNDYKRAKKAMVLREVHLEYLPNDQCALATDGDDDDDVDDDDMPTTSYNGRIHPDHMCTTGGPQNERDSCAYDSGSPIIVSGATSEEDVLVALVSWGEGCADPNFPAVNARITEGLDFIDESVCKYSAHPPPDFGCNPLPSNTSMAPSSSSSMQAPTPTVAPSSNTTNSYYSTDQMGAGLVLLLLVGLFLKRITTTKPHRNDDDDTVAWVLSPLPPFHKPWKALEKQFSSSSETEYLYQNSPSLSLASSRGSHVSYDAIATLTL